MKRHAQEEMGTPVASLIDVVFLLIIFFVVTASVEKDIIDQSIELAQAKYAKPAEQKNPLTVTINIDKDGNINIARQPMNLRTLRQILIGTYKDVGGQVPILIRCDADTRYHHVARVQDVVGEAGFYKIKLAAVVKAE